MPGPNRHSWVVLVSGIFEPLFYLLSIGVGIGALVGKVSGPAGHLVGFTSFVAPALLATSSMNGAVFDSTFNVFFRLKYAKFYDAALATPMRSGDIALGEIGWALIAAGCTRPRSWLSCWPWAWPTRPGPWRRCPRTC